MTNGLSCGLCPPMGFLPGQQAPVDRMSWTTDGPAPWLHPHRATAGASRLLRAGPPAPPGSVLSPLRFSRSGCFLSPPSGGITGERLPTFRARAADQAHVAYMPDAARPASGTPAGLIPGLVREPWF